METAVYPTGGVSALHGIQQVVPVPSPAAGADWSYQVPAGYYRRLLTGYSTFVTSAQVASRQLAYQITDGQNVLFFNGGNNNQNASGTYHLALLGNGGSNNGAIISTVNILGVPGVWLPPGYVLSSNTFNIQTADQWSGIFLWWECIDRELMQQHYFAEQKAKHALESMALGG